MSTLRSKYESTLLPFVIINQVGFYSIPLQSNYTIIYINTTENIDISFLDQDFYRIKITDSAETYQSISDKEKKFIPKEAYIFFPEHYNEQTVSLLSFLNITIKLNIVSLKKNETYSCQTLLVGRNLPQELFIASNNTKSLVPFDNYNETERSVSRKLMLAEYFGLIGAIDVDRVREIADAEVERNRQLTEPADYNHVDVQRGILINIGPHEANNDVEGGNLLLDVPIANPVENQPLVLAIPLNHEQRENYEQNQQNFLYWGVIAPVSVMAAIGLLCQHLNSTKITPSTYFLINSDLVTHNNNKIIDSIISNKNNILQTINYKYNPIPFPSDKLGYKQETSREYLVHPFLKIKTEDNPLTKLETSVLLKFIASSHQDQTPYLRGADTDFSSDANEKQINTLVSIAIGLLELGTVGILGYITYSSLKPIFLLHFYNYIDLDASSMFERVINNGAELVNNAVDLAGTAMEGDSFQT